MTFSVSRRVREMGIRMALGARAGDVVRLVCRQGVIQMAIGMTLGLAAGAMIVQLARAVLFEVEPGDPTVFLAVAGVLAAAGLVTSPMASGAFTSWGEPGPGKWITVYANAGHASRNAVSSSNVAEAIRTPIE